MGARHACQGMPKGIALASYDGVWRIVFANGQAWVREIAYCPWCGHRLGRGSSPSAFASGSPKNARAVRCVETGAVYASAAEAERRTGVGRSSIRDALRGASKLAGGLSWVYADGKPAPSGPRKRRKASSGGRGMRVRCVETGEEFESQRAAGEAIGASQPAVSYALRNGVAVNGLHFVDAGKGGSR